MKYDILLVEDEKELANLMVLFLEKAGYQVCVAVSGEKALQVLREHTIKMLLLDIMLPGIDGFGVLREVRKKGNIPVLIMSARVGKEDKLNGYELGADDYMEKPVDADLLVAKVRSLFSRSYGEMSQGNILSLGDITIDTNARVVTKNETVIELNGKEYELLLLLMENEGKTCNKDYLFAKIWGMDSLSENQTLTVHIKMLRDKIEENPKKPTHIKTVWGVGYRYEAVQ